MRTIFIAVIFTLCLAFNALSQESQAEKDLKVAEARLLKTLDALDKSEALNRSLQSLVDKQTQLLLINDEIIKRKDAIIADQAKMIGILEKKNQRRVSFLWGVFSIRF